VTDADREERYADLLRRRADVYAPEREANPYYGDDDIDLLRAMLYEADANALKHKAKVSELAVTINELRAEVDRLRACLASGPSLTQAFEDGFKKAEEMRVPPDADALAQAKQIVVDAIKRANIDCEDDLHLAQRVLDEITAGIARALTPTSPDADVMERANPDNYRFSDYPDLQAAAHHAIATMRVAIRALADFSPNPAPDDRDRDRLIAQAIVIGDPAGQQDREDRLRGRTRRAGRIVG